MTESGWPQTPGAWRVAQACEDAAHRFERAMRDLTTAPGITAEEAARIATQLLAVAGETDEEPP